MIFEQINKYPDPPPPVFYSSYNNNAKQETEEWKLTCEKALEECQKILQPGDTVELKFNTVKKQRVIIDHFLTDATKIYPYKDEPCFIMAKNPAYQSSGPTRYAIHEFDLTSIIKKESNNV